MNEPVETLALLPEIKWRFEKYIRRHVPAGAEVILTPFNVHGARAVVQLPVKRGTPTTLAVAQIPRIGKPWESVHGLVGPAVKQIRERAAKAKVTALSELDKK